MVHEGRCHCGAIRFSFETDQPLAPRTCQCSFCRKHGARNVTDPSGAATLRHSLEPLRYRFGTGITDFLICSRCGVYIGAVSTMDGQAYVTLNLNTFDDPHLHLTVTPVSYEGEAVSDRGERRRLKWTPLRLPA